jgi:ankyrin repeat protein
LKILLTHFPRVVWNMLFSDMIMMQTGDQREKWRFTTLHVACQEGHAQVVDLILQESNKLKRPECGSSKSDFVNAAGRHGITAIMIAVAQNHLIIVERLIQEPCINVNQTNDQGMTPFIFACAGGFTPIVKCLLQSRHYIDIDCVGFGLGL